MPEKINILKDSGETIASNIVSVFMIPDTEKKYIITTENAVDPHGLTVLHVSEIVDGSLQKVATDEEWSSIKTIMRAIISGNVGSYQYLPPFESIKAASQYSRDISVSAAASKQMIDNYSVAEKSNVVPVTSQSTVDAGGTIFPTNGGTAPDAEDELIPGISEIDAQPVPPSVLQGIDTTQQSNMMQPSMPIGMNSTPITTQPMMGTTPSTMDMNQPMMNQMTQTAPQPIIGMTPNLDSAQPMMQPSIEQNVVNTTEPIITTPVVPVEQNVGMQPMISVPEPTVPEIQSSIPVANPVLTSNNDNTMMGTMNNDVQVPNILDNPVPVLETPSPTDVSNINVNPNLMSPTPIVVTEDMEIPAPTVVNEQPEVQVLQPSVTVPTSQIVQEAQESQNNIDVPEVKIDTNASPSFAPNASLDEVVMAAQDMFMEGVKNLVQTIQEKVYRDLYTKEAELKEREASIEQREKLVNEQMMVVMSNLAAMQGKTLTSMPATVQASNDSDKNA